MTQTFVHVRCNAAGKIKRVKRDGRETIILPSYAAKADTVLNGIKYPRDELDKSLSGLNRTPAPLGHPVLNGKFVPANDPEARARTDIFAWNENPRWDGDRIALDVVIDEARAKESEGGKRVLNAVEKQEPICTSTGLLCNLDNADADDHKAVARGIVWDHVALLLDSEPAISPKEGVGIFVNAALPDENEIPVINSSLEDEAERDMNWALDSLARAVERRQKAPALERIKTAIMEALGLAEREPSLNRKEDDMAVSDEQFKALSEKVDTLSDTLKPDALGKVIGDVVANAVKPLVDAQAEFAANQKAKDDAELTDLVGKIVKANLMDEATAKELTLNAARALAKKAEPGKAAALNGATGDGEKQSGFKLPASDKKE